MQAPDSNVPVRPAADAAAAAAIANDAAIAAAIAGEEEAAAATIANDAGEEEGASWWSPGMPLIGPTGYAAQYDDTLSYGNQDFWRG